jgi:hypothetical protein
LWESATINSELVLGAIHEPLRPSPQPSRRSYRPPHTVPFGRKPLKSLVQPSARLGIGPLLAGCGRLRPPVARSEPLRLFVGVTDEREVFDVGKIVGLRQLFDYFRVAERGPECRHWPPRARDFGVLQEMKCPSRLVGECPPCVPYIARPFEPIEVRFNDNG